MTFIPAWNSGAPADHVAIEVATFETKELAELRQAMKRAPGTAAPTRRAEHRAWIGVALMAALAGLAVALGAEPWSAALCVVAGFGAAMLAMARAVTTERDACPNGMSYAFDATGFRWRNADFQADTSWSGASLFEGEHCLSIVKGRTVAHTVPKRVASPDVLARVRALAAAGGASVD